MRLMNRQIIAVFFGALIAFACRYKDSKADAGDNKQIRRKYSSVISPWFLINFLFVELLVELIFSGEPVLSVLDYEFSLNAGVFISIAVFYMVFMLFLPVLRKNVSARTIALIWLLPNYMYLTTMSSNAADSPLLVIDIGNVSIRIIALIWLAGAVIVFAAYVLRHLVFRYKLLHNAAAVGPESVRSLWTSMQLEYGFEKPCIGIAISDSASTPVSIGLFRKSTVLVLPHSDYTEEELKLIFNHELVHISHEDCGIKLFIAFCNAMCWFNPLMWIAMRKCTEDLELSCDEFVLEACSNEDKLLYGNLILSSAGNEAGFSTCLSAGAEALKYRLTNIYKPGEKLRGNIIAGILMTIMLLTSGLIAVSYNHMPVERLLDINSVAGNAEFDVASLYEGSSHTTYYCNEPEALNHYIMNLKVCELTGIYNNMSHDGKTMRCQYMTDDGFLVIAISDKEISIIPVYVKNKMPSRTYYLDDPVDWDYIMSMLQLIPETAELENQ